LSRVVDRPSLRAVRMDGGASIMREIRLRLLTTALLAAGLSSARCERSDRSDWLQQRCLLDPLLPVARLASLPPEASTSSEPRLTSLRSSSSGRIPALTSLAAHGLGPALGLYSLGTSKSIGWRSPVLAASVAATATRPGLRHSKPLSVSSTSLYKFVGRRVRCAGVQPWLNWAQ
jgi:hypothetical protein